MLIPRDILADRRTAVFLDASSTFSNCSSESPVVQSTQGSCFSIQYSKSPSTAGATLKSITTSAETSQSLILVNTGNGFFPSSWASMPATNVISASSAARPAITCPILPLHPCIIAFIIIHNLLAFIKSRTLPSLF